MAEQANSRPDSDYLAQGKSGSSRAGPQVRAHMEDQAVAPMPRATCQRSNSRWVLEEAVMAAVLPSVANRGGSMIRTHTGGPTMPP